MGKGIEKVIERAGQIAKDKGYRFNVIDRGSLSEESLYYASLELDDDPYGRCGKCNGLVYKNLVEVYDNGMIRVYGVCRNCGETLIEFESGPLLPRAIEPGVDPWKELKIPELVAVFSRPEKDMQKIDLDDLV